MVRSHSVLLLLAVASLCALCVRSDRITYEAEDAHITGVGQVVLDEYVHGVSGRGYAVFGGKKVDIVMPAKAIFVCNIPEDGDYKVYLTHKVEQTTVLNVYANGHHNVQTTLEGKGYNWATTAEMLTLRQGVNSIVYEALTHKGGDRIMIDYIIVDGAVPLAGRGATLPYYEIEAEAATYTGTIVGPSRTSVGPGNLASEASGRKAVSISGSQYVEFTLKGSANGIVIRYSIPDAPNGQGQPGVLNLLIDGSLFQAVPVTSHFAYSYGGYPFNKNPGSGQAHHFYDDVRVYFNKTLPAGAKVRLQGTTNLVYTIDLADFYTVPAPLPQPAGSLSIVDYGADPSGKKDSTSAITAAITAGQNQNKVVWIPNGNFTVNSRFPLMKRVVIRGAGPWFSYVWGTVNHGVGFGANWSPSSTTNFELYDFSIIGDTNDRDDGAIDSGVTGSPQSVIVQNVWIEHTKCGLWTDGPYTDLSVIGVTIRNIFADGINLHKGVSNVVVQQSILRNTGDDALAIWSEQQTDSKNVFKFNTIAVPVLANGIGFYGGSDNSATDNIVSDTVCQGSGLHAGNRYNSAELGGTTLFARNTVIRGGGSAADNSSWNGGVWFWAQEHNIVNPIQFTDSEILDSTWTAILFWGAGTTISGVTFSNVTIDGSGTYAISIQGPIGSTSIDHFTVKNVRWTPYCTYETNFKVVEGTGNVGWNATSGCHPPY